MDQSADLQSKIREIYRNSDLSSEEKSKQVFALLNPTTIPSNDESQSDKNLLPKCEHYQRDCIIQCPDCQQWCRCRHCHNNDQTTHQLDRFKINVISCVKCEHLQPPSNSCQSCQHKFSEFYCDICHLWTQNQNYHCDSCGICRRGNPEEFQHCDTCGTCMAKDHQCSENFLSGCCPICQEELFQSISRVTQLHCGHALHLDCLMEYISSDYRCPTCHRSLGDLSNHWERISNYLADEIFPPPYCYWESEIQCIDCQHKAVVPFHYRYHQCPGCGGYNTQKLNTIPHEPN